MIGAQIFGERYFFSLAKFESSFFKDLYYSGALKLLWS